MSAYLSVELGVFSGRFVEFIGHLAKFFQAEGTKVCLSHLGLLPRTCG